MFNFIQTIMPGCLRYLLFQAGNPLNEEGMHKAQESC
jgi:hypothetical protein